MSYQPVNFIKLQSLPLFREVLLALSESYENAVPGTPDERTFEFPNWPSITTRKYATVTADTEFCSQSKIERVAEAYENLGLGVIISHDNEHRSFTMTLVWDEKIQQN